jgi:hypothetical protein
MLKMRNISCRCHLPIHPDYKELKGFAVGYAKRRFQIGRKDGRKLKAPSFRCCVKSVGVTPRFTYNPSNVRSIADPIFSISEDSRQDFSLAPAA